MYTTSDRKRQIFCVIVLVSILCVTLILSLLAYAVPISFIRFGLPVPSICVNLAKTLDTKESAIFTAKEMLEKGKPADAVIKLKAFVEKEGHASNEGQVASYMLIEAYREAGQFKEGLNEADILISALTKSQTSLNVMSGKSVNNEDNITLIELQHLREALSNQLSMVRKYTDQLNHTKDTLDRSLLERTIAAYRFDNIAADKALIKSIHLAMLRHNISDKTLTKLIVLYRISHTHPLVASLDNKLLRIVRQHKASPSCRFLSLSLISRILPRSKVAELSRNILNETYTEGNEKLCQLAGALIEEQNRILRDNHVASILNGANKVVDQAVALEAAGKWNESLLKYQSVSDIVRASETNDNNAPMKYLGQISRSLPLIRAASKIVTENDSCEYLGIDHTIGSNWRGIIGNEAWILFALHGDDLCGGPRIMDDSFTYNAYIGDKNNLIRRWRDPEGYQSRSNSDLPLVDPVIPGKSVISFLDDNGESYPSGIGPDLYIDLKIPSGSHILSIPLHFSDPNNKKALYRIYIIDNADGNNIPDSDDDVKCLATALLSASDGAGYARFALNGPANYKLIIRKLNSLNANIPALFLDPDPRVGKKINLAQDFKSSEIETAGFNDKPIITNGLVKAPDYSSVIYLVQQLWKKYNELINNPDQLHISDDQWLNIAQQASTYSSDSGLSQLQKSVTAWLAWRASEQCTINRRLSAIYFENYLRARYGSNRNYNMDTMTNQEKISMLHSLSESFIKKGNLAYAEKADRLAWDIGTTGSSFASLKNEEKLAVIKSLWTNGVTKFIRMEHCRLSQGLADNNQGTVDIAVDTDYASNQASIVTSLLSKNESEPHINRAWLDFLSESLKLSINSVNVENEDKRIIQPIGSIIYCAACMPIIGKDNDFPVMRPDQMELLARSYIARSAFPDDLHTQDIKYAKNILLTITKKYDKYPRNKQIADLASSL